MAFLVARRKRRWSDRDRYFGPFTFAYDRKYRPLAIILGSGGEEDDGCRIRFSAFGCTLICELPAVVRPQRRWVDLSKAEWAKDREGPKGYWDIHPREFGVSLNDGFLQVPWGAQTMDSSTDQGWSCFLPWTQWRQTAHRIYNGDGSLAADVSGKPFGDLFAAEKAAIKARFLVEDFDGEMVGVSVHIEERERRLGTGWFRWLGYLRTRRCTRALDINFDKEVGRDKGSWKGGLCGTGLTMLPGETAQQAFRRFCDQDQRAKQGAFRLRFVAA